MGARGASGKTSDLSWAFGGDQGPPAADGNLGLLGRTRSSEPFAQCGLFFIGPRATEDNRTVDGIKQATVLYAARLAGFGNFEQTHQVG